MNRNELKNLRDSYYKEVQRREKINSLLENELVIEYLKTKGLEREPLDVHNIRDILKEVLKDFQVTETNGIYVCTSSYYIDCHISYQDTEYYTVPVEIDSKYAERKTYLDIESGKLVRGSIDKDQYNELISEFEKNHIVLNPFNTHVNQNEYQEVRMDFFETALSHGQAKGKRLLLDKYKRL